MGDTKEEIFRKINDYFVKIDVQKVWNMWFVIIIVSFIIDVVFSIMGIETLFSDQKGTIVAIDVVIWTFTMSIFVYCLGKVDQKYYGIQVADIFFRGLCVKKIYFVAATVFAEIVLLIIMTVFGAGIGVFVLTLFQCYVMIYIILMVLQRTSGAFVMSQVREEIRDTYRIEYFESQVCYRDTGIFGCMVHNINYDSYDEVGKLLGMLRYYNKNLRQQINSEIEIGAKKYINECSKEIARHMYMNRIEANQKAVMDWYREDESCIEIKQGILMHMMEEFGSGYEAAALEKLLDSETEYYRELHIWVFVYNVYLQEFEGQDWRAFYIEYLMRKMRFGAVRTDAVTAIGYWNQITDAENLYSLFRYIF